MHKRLSSIVFVVLSLAACDDKKDGQGAAASASAAVAAPPSAAPIAASAAAIASAPAVESAAPAASSSSSMITGDAKDVVLTVKEPAKEPEKSIKAQAGGSVTVFLPDHPGTVWSVDTSDKSLGKAKEEVMPGMAPQTMGHMFKWTTNGPVLKAGQKYKVQFVNKKAADKAAKPGETFALTIELT
jgi:hypothetical protein